MSENGHIKIQRKAQWYLENDVHVYLIMSQAMFRALRNEESQFNIHKLKSGQALLGDFEKLGLSRQQYRDALDRIVKIYKIGTIQGTNKGTIITIINTTFCDINLPTEEPSKEPKKNQQRTTKEEVRSKKKEIILSEAALSLLEYFNFSLLKIEELKGKQSLRKTAKEFDELLLSYSFDEIKKTIDYAHTGFWKAHVHGPKYFKEKFPTLYTQLNNLKSIGKVTDMTLEIKEKYKNFARKNESKICDMNADPLGIWFIPHHGQNNQFHLKFTEHGFQEQLKNMCLKYQFKIINI
jgi:hypothetical protein